MSSPKPNFVDVSNQGRKSIIWQYLWQDKESENSECQLWKPAKAAETTETVEANVQKSLTKNRQNIQRASLPNDKSKTAKGSPSIKTLFQKGPGKTKASHQPKAEMEANKKKNAKKENIWTADANSDVSDSQLNDSNDSDETQIVYK